MKYNSIIFYMLSATVVFCILQGCNRFDNFDGPESVLYGRLTYQGEYIGVRGSGAKVQMQLYQDGFGKKDPIPVNVTQDGTFQALLFNGEYKLVTRDKNGPWVNRRDTVYLTVRGNATCEYQVEPYWLIRNEKFSVDGNQLVARFDLEEVTSGRAVTSAFLLVNNTQFVDDVSSVSRVNLANPPASAGLQIEMELDGLSSYPVLYARIGIEIAGVSDYLFSKVIQIK